MGCDILNVSTVLDHILKQFNYTEIKLCTVRKYQTWTQWRYMDSRNIKINHTNCNLYKVQVLEPLCPSGSDRQRVWVDTLSRMSVHHCHRQHASCWSLHQHMLNDRHTLHAQHDAPHRTHQNNTLVPHMNLVQVLSSQLQIWHSIRTML